MFKLSFETDNAAFEDAGHATETARILRHLADHIEAGDLDGPAFDLNGNKVGSYALTGPEPEPESLAAFIERMGLTMAATRIPQRLDGAESWAAGSSHYVVTISRSGHTAQAFQFSQGSAHKSPPRLRDVLDCLASDAASYANARDEDDLAAEMCIENPSEARKLWDALKDTDGKLRALLGPGELETLMFRTERG